MTVQGSSVPLSGVAQPYTELRITPGSDWSVPLYVTDGAFYVDVNDMVMQLRRDQNPNSQLLAILTEDTGGGIVRSDVGRYTLSMTAEQTSMIPPGRGFWDIYGLFGQARVQVDNGTLLIAPRVTAPYPVPYSPGNGPGPPPMAQASQVVVTGTAAVNLSPYRIVVPNNQGQFIYANASDPAGPGPFGMVLAPANGAFPVDMAFFGSVVSDSWAWTPGLPLYLGQTGTLTQVVPTKAGGANVMVRLADVLSSHKIFYHPASPIVLS